MRLPALSILLALSLLVAAPASAVTILSVDDGTSETAVGHGGSGDFLWGNYFTEFAGGTMVSEIEIAFANFGVSVGRSYQALLYDDLDDDGDPTSGLVLLTSLSSSVANPQPIGPNTFEIADIVDTVVTGGFYVAVYMDGTGNPFPAPFDQSSNSGQSWFAEHDVIGALDVNDPFGTATLSGEPSSFGLPGNFMVRAVVPEPATAALVALGLAGLAARRSPRLRSAD